MVVEMKSELQIFQQKQNIFSDFTYFVQIVNANYLV